MWLRLTFFDTAVAFVTVNLVFYAFEVAPFLFEWAGEKGNGLGGAQYHKYIFQCYCLTGAQSLFSKEVEYNEMSVLH